jgi:hypothetical protein
MSHSFSNYMINITCLNEVHYSLLKSYTQGYIPNDIIGVFLVPRSKYAPLSETTIGTPVLQIHQDEVCDGLRCHCQLPSPYPTNSSG